MKSQPKIAGRNKISRIVLTIKQNKLLAAAVLAYFVIFTTLSVLKHESFHSTAFDMGVFVQNVWMMSQGRMGINTVNGFIAFADHVQPILFIPAMLYRLFPSPILLIVLQVLMISLGAIPLYLIARKKLGEKIAVVFAIAYFLYPPTQYFTLFDFHTEAFLVRSCCSQSTSLRGNQRCGCLPSSSLQGSPRSTFP